MQCKVSLQSGAHHVNQQPETWVHETGTQTDASPSQHIAKEPGWLAYQLAGWLLHVQMKCAAAC